MSYPTASKSIELLEKWRDRHSDIDRLMNSVKEVFGSLPESQFNDTTWKVFADYTEALCIILGDAGAPKNESWLVWFWLENDMGLSGLSAGYNSRLTAINTLEQLLELIIKGRED